MSEAGGKTEAAPENLFFTQSNISVDSEGAAISAILSKLLKVESILNSAAKDIFASIPEKSGSVAGIFWQCSKDAPQGKPDLIPAGVSCAQPGRKPPAVCPKQNFHWKFG